MDPAIVQLLYIAGGVALGWVGKKLHLNATVPVAPPVAAPPAVPIPPVPVVPPLPGVPLPVPAPAGGFDLSADTLALAKLIEDLRAKKAIQDLINDARPILHDLLGLDLPASVPAPAPVPATPKAA